MAAKREQNDCQAVNFIYNSLFFSFSFLFCFGFRPNQDEKKKMHIIVKKISGLVQWFTYLYTDHELSKNNHPLLTYNT